MRAYVLICEDEFSVYALENSDGTCNVVELLDMSNSSNEEDKKWRVSMSKRIARLAERKAQTNEIYHLITDGIWQISSGQYRLLYFYDAGHLIICTHYFKKKTNKTLSKEIKKALKHREEYFKAKKDHALSFKT